MSDMFVVYAYNVVLVIGNSILKVLGIFGENLLFVYYKMDVIDRYLGELSEFVFLMEFCFVVGVGLLAVDCVLVFRNKGVFVIYVVRRNGNDFKIIYNQLLGVVYLEYYKVGQMIKGDVITVYGKDVLYIVYIKIIFVEIRKDKECILKKVDGILFKQKVLNVFVLIGVMLDFLFLYGIGGFGVNFVKNIDSKENLIYINFFSYEVVNEFGLFVVGFLIGDNFVRFGIGGVLGIVNYFMREDEQLKELLIFLNVVNICCIKKYKLNQWWCILYLYQ